MVLSCANLLSADADADPALRTHDLCARWPRSLCQMPALPLPGRYQAYIAPTSRWPYVGLILTSLGPSYATRTYPGPNAIIIWQGFCKQGLEPPPQCVLNALMT